MHNVMGHKVMIHYILYITAFEKKLSKLTYEIHVKLSNVIPLFLLPKIKEVVYCPIFQNHLYLLLRQMLHQP